MVSKMQLELNYFWWLKHYKIYFRKCDFKILMDAEKLIIENFNDEDMNYASI